MYAHNLVAQPTHKGTCHKTSLQISVATLCIVIDESKVGEHINSSFHFFIASLKPCCALSDQLHMSSLNNKRPKLLRKTA